MADGQVSADAMEVLKVDEATLKLVDFVVASGEKVEKPVEGEAYVYQVERHCCVSFRRSCMHMRSCVFILGLARIRPHRLVTGVLSFHGTSKLNPKTLGWPSISCPPTSP